jgi:hypothetical protein
MTLVATLSVDKNTQLLGIEWRQGSWLCLHPLFVMKLAFREEKEDTRYIHCAV